MPKLINILDKSDVSGSKKYTVDNYKLLGWIITSDQVDLYFIFTGPSIDLLIKNSYKITEEELQYFNNPIFQCINIAKFDKNQKAYISSLISQFDHNNTFYSNLCPLQGTFDNTKYQLVTSTKKGIIITNVTVPDIMYRQLELLHDCITFMKPFNPLVYKRGDYTAKNLIKGKIKVVGQSVNQSLITIHILYSSTNHIKDTIFDMKWINEKGYKIIDTGFKTMSNRVEINLNNICIIRYKSSNGNILNTIAIKDLNDNIYLLEDEKISETILFDPERLFNKENKNEKNNN